MKPRKQSKLDRYARYAVSTPMPWLSIMSLAAKHFPKNLRQWAADQIMLRVVQMKYCA
jgi:hypothetical protein